MDGVEYMSKIEKLKYLEVNVVKEKTLDIREVIVQLAGRCPVLQTLDVLHVKGELWFGQMFGQHFPQKKLVLSNLEVKDSFTFDWPEHLSVVGLKISGKLDDASILKVRLYHFITAKY